jgi:glycosyltransferase involved in cell wall biosynthesis
LLNFKKEESPVVNQPLVSIGIPVYNGERLIGQALQALLAQTYDHLELVISDNSSTDRTGEICQEYAAKDPRIKYFRNAANIGIYANYRRVVALATGDYFMWAAVDDLKPSTAIQECVRALLDNQRAVMAHGMILVRTAAGLNLVEYANTVDAMESNAGARIRKFTRAIQHNGMFYGLYRREALTRAILGNHLGQDYLLCLQMCLLGEIAYVKSPTMICRERKAIASSSPMYREAPLTLNHLLTANRIYRRKCWTVLLRGSYYVATVGKLGGLERLAAIVAHLTEFSALYRSKLAKEILYQTFEPFAWLSTSVWSLAQRWPVTFRIARRVQSCLMPRTDDAS